MLLVVFPGSYRPTLLCIVGSESGVSGVARDGSCDILAGGQASSV